MYSCQHCNKSYLNAGSLAGYEPYCKLNPNRTQRKKSPNAHAKIGTEPWNMGIKTGRALVWDEKFPLIEVLVENSTYARHLVKKRIRDNSLIPYECACCGNGPEWQGKPMPLILDHINGINNDNRIENLRFVCSNCDSQLDTYKSRNIKKKKWKLNRVRDRTRLESDGSRKAWISSIPGFRHYRTYIK